MSPDPSRRGPLGFRPDIQGVRAIAVLLVMAHHIAPGFLTGGYLGVDVFFVVSGYLITALLLREADRDGRSRSPVSTPDGHEGSCPPRRWSLS